MAYLPAHSPLGQTLQRFPFWQAHRQLLQRHQQRQDGLQAWPPRALAQWTQELGVLAVALPAGACLLLCARLGQGHARPMEPVFAQLALQHEAAGRLAAQAELDLLDAVGHGHLGQVGGAQRVDGLHLLLLLGLEGRHNGGGLACLLQALLQVAEGVRVVGPPFLLHQLLDALPFTLAVAIHANVHTGTEDLREGSTSKDEVVCSEVRIYQELLQCNT